MLTFFLALQIFDDDIINSSTQVRKFIVLRARDAYEMRK